MSSRRVIGTYLAIAGLYTLSASLIWGVNTLFLLAAGLTITEVFVANAAFTAGMMLFEIPTGVVADTSGRRVSFLASIVVLFAGTLAYLWLYEIQAGVVAFSAASVLLGLGFTFYSGAVEAWLVDALATTGFDGPLDSVFAKGGYVTGAAMLVGTVGGGFLGQASLALPYVVRAVLLVVVFSLALAGMHDVGFETRKIPLGAYPSEMRRIALAGIRHGWDRRSVRMLMGFSFVQGGVLTWMFYAWPPYLLELLDADAVWVAGAVAGAIAVAMMLGNAIADRLTRVCGRRSTLLMWAVGVEAAAAAGMGLTSSFWVATALLLVVMGATGVLSPVKQGYLHQVIPSSERATVVSFDSMIGSGGSVLGQVGLGRLSDRQGLAAGYVTAGVVTAAALPILVALRRLAEPADAIVGASPKAACAAQGLPEISALDTVPRLD